MPRATEQSGQGSRNQGVKDSSVRTLESSNPQVLDSSSLVRLSLLVACASVLQVAESLLPHPIPGVRLGLANIITVIAMVYIGPASAVELAVLRTLVSSMVMGTFLTPTFVLSFAGGVVSALVMILLFRLSGHGMFSFGLVGISVGGAVSHIATQVALVYLLFIRSSGVLWLWPWLILSAVVTGILTGMIAAQAVRRLESNASGVKEPGTRGFELPDTLPLESSHRQTGAAAANPGPLSFIRRLRPEVKVAAVVIIGLVVVIFSGYRLYVAVFGLLSLIAIVARARPSSLVVGLRRVWALLLMSFALPVVFSPWGRILLAFGPLRITDQGLHDGGIFAARMLLLFFATALLAWTTPPAEVATGLERLLAPLRVVGVRPGWLARSLALSWSYFPGFWENVRQMVGHDRGRRSWLDRMVHLPGDIVADLYLLASNAAYPVSHQM